MEKYQEQANIYKFRGELVKEILNTVKTKYDGVLTNCFGASKTNGKLSFTYNIKDR